MLRKVNASFLVLILFFSLINPTISKAETVKANQTNIEKVDVTDTSDYENAIKKVKKLEKLATAYKNQTPECKFDKLFLVTSYIRSARYSGMSWTNLAGTPDAKFAKYVEDKQGETDLKSLQTIGTVKTPFGDNIDFVHMIAGINICIYYPNESAKCIAGWAGDVAQLSIEIAKAIPVEADLKPNIKAIKKEVNARFGKSTSSFSYEDVNADIDGLNIAKILKNGHASTLSKALTQHYVSTKTDKQRIFEFYTNASMGDTHLDKTMRQSKLVDGFQYMLKTDFFTSLYISFNIDTDEHNQKYFNDFFKICNDVVVEYFVKYVMSISED